jgi:hypothetical protein
MSSQQLRDSKGSNLSASGDNAVFAGGFNPDAIDWIKVEEPKKFEFERGSILVGILTSAERVELRDDKGISKPAMRYTVLDHDSKKDVFFHGTAKLDSMIKPYMVGRFMSITCTGEDSNVVRNGRAMKTFEIQHSRQTAPGYTSAGTAVTDDDIPF